MWSNTLPIDVIRSIALTASDILEVQTKSVESERVIKEILPLSYFLYDAPMTKNSDGVEDCVYIVNYENDNGFSILSRDTRVPTLLL